MHWQVKPLSKQSQISGQAFQPGQEIISFLSKNDQGDLLRTDVAESEFEGFVPPGTVLGWWRQQVKAEEDKIQAKHQAIKSAEGLFLSLYAEGVEPSEERTILKSLLALMLERKRLLKPRGKALVGKPQKYLLVKTKESFEVPAVDLTAETVLKIQEQLWAVIGKN